MRRKYQIITEHPMYIKVFLANIKCDNEESLKPLLDLLDQALQAKEKEVIKKLRKK